MAHQKVTSDFPTAELPQIRADEEDRTPVISFEVPPLANSTPVLTNWAFSASLSAIEYFALSEWPNRQPVAENYVRARNELAPSHLPSPARST